MTDQADHLVQFSNILATRVAAMKHAIVAIRLAHERHVTGTVWQSDIIVTSEQSLPRRDEFEIVAAGGSVLICEDRWTRSWHQYRDPAACRVDRVAIHCRERGACRRGCSRDRSRRIGWRECAFGARQSHRRRMA